MDKISVIIPVYKVEKYLKRCVESIVNQTYKNLEIILVDDGSPDNCPQMCDEWAEKDGRIKVIHKVNSGVLSARLCGVEAAHGRYVAFVDSDDWIEKDYFEYLYNLANSNSAQVASCAFYGVNEGETEAKITFALDEEIKAYGFEGTVKYMNEDSLWSMCNKIYERQLFDKLPKLPEGITFSEDMMLNYFIYKNIDKIAVSNIPKYYYFRHSGSAISGCITYSLIDSSMLAYKTIDDDFDKGSSAYPYQISNKLQNDYFLLNSIIRNRACTDRYKILRKDILSFRRYIFSRKYKNAFRKKDRYATALLCVCPFVYNALIRLRTKLRGY